MQVTISANGKNIKTEISEEQAKILGLVEDKPKTGYESLGTGETYYLVDVDDEITTMKYDSRYFLWRYIRYICNSVGVKNVWRTSDKLQNLY